IRPGHQAAGTHPEATNVHQACAPPAENHQEAANGPPGPPPTPEPTRKLRTVTPPAHQPGRKPPPSHWRRTEQNSSAGGTGLGRLGHLDQSAGTDVVQV